MSSVRPRARRGRVDLLPVGEPERSRLRQEELGHPGDVDVLVALLVDRPSRRTPRRRRRPAGVNRATGDSGDAMKSAQSRERMPPPPPARRRRRRSRQRPSARAWCPRCTALPSHTRTTSTDLKRLPSGKPSASVLVRGIRHDHRRAVLRHEAGRELGGAEVEGGELLRVGDLLGLARHERRPLAVEVDELLRDRLPLGGVRREQGRGAEAGEDVAELPAEVEAVLHRHVHALPGLRAVRVARVAGEEDPRGVALVDGRRRRTCR